jgi:hypothetical protein
VSNELKWLDSLGGPWLLAPLPIVDKWQGGLSSSVLTGGASDYEKLCADMTLNGTSTYIAAVGPARDLLGIGEMAGGITVVNVKGLGQCIVEWFGADNDASLSERLGNAEFDDVLNEVELNAPGTTYILFDSVWPGNRKPDSLSLELARGKHKVTARTAKFHDAEFVVTNFALQ